MSLGDTLREVQRLQRQQQQRRQRHRKQRIRNQILILTGLALAFQLRRNTP